MAEMLTRSRHREWEDFTSMALGLLVAFSPWIAGAPITPTMELNAVLAGFLVFSVSAIEVTEPGRWQERLKLLAGLWIEASPLTLGHWHLPRLMLLQVALGAVIAAMAVLELWQDRNRTFGVT